MQEFSLRGKVPLGRSTRLAEDTAAGPAEEQAGTSGLPEKAEEAKSELGLQSKLLRQSSV